MNVIESKPSFPRTREPSGIDYMHSKALDPCVRGDDGQPMLSLLATAVQT